MQHQREDVAIRHAVAFRAITLTAKKITAGRKIAARGKSVWRKMKVIFYIKKRQKFQKV